MVVIFEMEAATKELSQRNRKAGDPFPVVGDEQRQLQVLHCVEL